MWPVVAEPVGGDATIGPCDGANQRLLVQSMGCDLKATEAKCEATHGAHLVPATVLSKRPPGEVLGLVGTAVGHDASDMPCA